MSKAADNEERKLSFREVLDKSAASAMRGGIAGGIAMGANVAALMWIRTTVCSSICQYEAIVLPATGYLSNCDVIVQTLLL